MSRHSETVDRALRHAVNTAAENARTMRGVARTLRAGEAVPFFAPGEAGAIAADYIAADHERFAADCRRELDGTAEEGEGDVADHGPVEDLPRVPSRPSQQESR